MIWAFAGILWLAIGGGTFLWLCCYTAGKATREDCLFAAFASTLGVGIPLIVGFILLAEKVQTTDFWSKEVFSCKRKGEA